MLRFYFNKDFVPAQKPEREGGIVAGEDRLTNALQTCLIKSFQKDRFVFATALAFDTGGANHHLGVDTAA